MITICPNKACNQKYHVKPEMVGSVAKCKKCNNRFKIEEFIYSTRASDLKPNKNDFGKRIQKDSSDVHSPSKKILPFPAIAICPNKACNQRYHVKLEMVGRIAKCKKCNNRFKIEELIYSTKASDLKPDKNDFIKRVQKNRSDIHLPSKKILPFSDTESFQKYLNKPFRKNNYKALSLFFILFFGIFAFLFVGNFHIISESNKGLSIVHRKAFGFSNFFINADQIADMPSDSAKLKFPIKFNVLQREGIIQSKETPKSQIDDNERKEIDQAIRDAQKEIYEMIKKNRGL